jgi:hypothetical protein
MLDFIRNFERDEDGVWRCTANCEINHPLGRIQIAEGTRFRAGTIFMAVDIVQLLEQERERNHRQQESPKQVLQP